jgi:hypothetical protein
MLIANGLSVNADRFEVVSADRCEAFELRIWARVFDKNSNLLEADDFVDLKLSLAEMHIAKGGRVIDVSKNFSDEFDVVYLSFGYWNWEMMKPFTDCAQAVRPYSKGSSHDLINDLVSMA